MKTDTRKESLLNQQLALSAYLDALLHEEVAPEAEVATAQEAVEASPARPSKQAEPEPVAGSRADGSPAVIETAVPAREADIPEWAENRFQALLFEVAGLTLAVPLTRLKGVVPNDQGLTPMPGHSPLFLGVVPYQGFQSKVVDTARFVLPQEHAVQLDEDAGERSTHLVMIDEGRWALACGGIGDVVELGESDVKWRSADGKRVWLAGTVIERMCALLDIDALTQQLVDGMA